jgi:hypothetical protein
MAFGADPTSSTSGPPSIERAVDDVALMRDDGRGAAAIHEAGLDALPVLARHLTEDAPIEVAERYEAILKSVLLERLRGSVDGATARRVARFQQEIGFLFKYKSYAVKCATPLGYSVFLQQPGEGFSFQRHITRKTEVFHILEVQPGGYAFFCRHEEWARAYDPIAFAGWLSGKADPRYDAFRIPVSPGDVFVIDQLNVVHTVVGCVLEEFATVSTDMVDRLYDQNLGRPMPDEFTREWSRRRLEGITFPDRARLLPLDGSTRGARTVQPVRVRGGSVATLADSFVVARRHRVDPRSSTALQHDDERAAILHVTAGRGRVIVADAAEAGRPDPPSLPAGRADVLLIAPGARYGFVNEGDDRLEVSEHRITLDAALA